MDFTVEDLNQIAAFVGYNSIIDYREEENFFYITAEVRDIYSNRPYFFQQCFSPLYDLATKEFIKFEFARRAKSEIKEAILQKKLNY